MKKIRFLQLIIFSLILIQFTSAQTTFRFSYDVGAFDITGGMVETPTGDFVIAGLNNSFGPYYGNAIKINSSGTVVWAKSYTAGFASAFNDIKNVSTGGYIITGQSTSSGGGAILIRLDVNGNILWAKKYQLPDRPGDDASSEYGNAVIETSDGGFLVGGGVDYFWDGVSANTVDTSSALGFKVDANGTLQWSRVWTITTTNPDEHYINDVAESADGYFFVGQSSEGSGTLNSDGDYPRNALLIKTTTAGALTYIRRWGVGNTTSQGINAALRLTTGANAGRILLGGFDDIHAFLITVEGVGSTPTMGAFNRRINGAAFPPKNILIQDIMENSDGNYSIIGTQIEPLSFLFYTAILKINSSTGAIIFGRGYTPIGLSSILPEGGLCSDQGYYISMTDQQNTGFNYNVIRTDANGQLGTTAGCTSTALNPGTTTYSTTLTTPTNANFNNLFSETSFSPTVSNMAPTTTQHCLNVSCVPPAAASSVTASPNPICAGQSTTISATGTGTGVVYNVFTTSTGGTSIGSTPLVVTPTTTTTYYVETAVSGQPSCLSTTRVPVTITVNPVPVPSPTNNGPVCSGNTITLNASGGGTYSWSGPNSFSSTLQSPSITSAGTSSAGIYTVTVTGANTCTASATTTVSVTTTPTISVTSQTNVSCFGGSTGAISVSATGGNGSYTYAWTPSGGNSSTASNLSAGSYTVAVTSASCSATQSFTITQPSSGISTSTTSTSAACGTNNGSASVNASGGTGTLSYAWNPGGQTSATATNLAGGTTYTCTVTDANSCTVQATVSVTTAAGPTVTVSSQTNVSCFGGNNGAASVSTSGGSGSYTYTWSPTGGNNNSATGLTAGNYTVTANDGGCVSTQVVNITQPTQITGTISTSNTNCGASTGSATITANGGTGTLSYSWSTGSATTSTINNLASGTYTCIVTDGNSCTVAVTGIVNSNNAPTVSLTSQSDVSCNGGSNGSASISASGGTGTITYSWTPTGGTNPSANGLTAGTYTIIVTDAANCAASETVTINEPTALSSSTTSTTSACGSSTGSAAVTVSGGTGAYSYLWVPGGQTTAVVSNLSAGTYVVAITDANNCTISDTALVTNPTSPTITITGVSSGCVGDMITLTASGGITYNWSGPNGFSSTTDTIVINNLSLSDGGTYTVTGLDANGCSGNTTEIITVNTTPNASASTSAIQYCEGSTINLFATGGSSYQWSGPLSFTSALQNPTLSNAAINLSGTYSVIVSNGNCSDTATVQVIIIASPVAVATGGGIFCSGDNITLHATGGGNYSWSGPGAFVSSNQDPTISNATGFNSGTYTLVVTDANTNCSDTTTLLVSINLTTSSSVTVAICAGQSYVLPSGNSVSTAGIYSDTLTYLSGCDSIIISTTLSVNPLPNVTITATQDTFINGGSSTLSASGATNYLWNPSGTGSTYVFSPTSSGNYTVCVIGSDNQGCSDTACIQIYVKDLDCGEIFVPTAFSPNGDNANDELCIFGTGCIKVMELRIYDRWGELVFESTEPTKCWDGKFNGNTLNPAVFAYVLTATTISGEEIKLIGNITLVK